MKLNEVRKTIKPDGTVIVHKRGGDQVIKPSDANKDEFARKSFRLQREYLQHLFVHQRACATTVYKYMMELQEQHPDAEVTVASLNHYQNGSAKSFALPETYVQALATTTSLSQQELSKLKRLFVRMLNAKKQFEDASGDTVNFYARSKGYYRP